MGSTVINLTSTTSWSWSNANGATQITIEALGGGGAGGAATGNPATGGGGKGGSYAKAVVTKGAESSLDISLGVGGVGGSGNGGNGTPSTITQNGTVVLRASGGNGGVAGTANSTNGAGATAVNGTAVGSTIFVGGNGGTGNFTSGVQGSGAGGGSAGSAANGGNASVNTPGSAGSGGFLNGQNYAGSGAIGVGNSSAGGAGVIYGGAGSGGKANNNTDRIGGDGRQGVILITWNDTLSSQKSPSNAANVATVGTVAWQNETNVTSSDGSYATASDNSGSLVSTNYLQATGFGFSIPTGATIQGIVAEIKKVNPNSLNSDVTDSAVYLMIGGVLAGDNLAKTFETWGNIEAYDSYGANNNLWGTTPTAAQINGSDFGISIGVTLQSGAAAAEAQIDHVRLTVYYTGGSQTGNSTGMFFGAC